MNPISRLRFYALAGYARRQPPIPVFDREWYQAEDERLLGFIGMDSVDEDFAAQVLARDGAGRFHMVAVTTWFADITDARVALDVKFEEVKASEDDYCADNKRAPFDIMTPRIPVEKQHPLFTILSTDIRYSSAKELIEQMSPYFEDVDGNFVEQFQSVAFDARLFELYLFAALKEMEYSFDRTHAAPDYHCFNFLGEFFVEAATVQPTNNAPPPDIQTLADILAYNEGYAAIKYGSVLFSKLNKKYWGHSHVAGRPLVFAVQDFHRKLSMMWTAPALPTYLYGYAHDASRDAHGHLIITPRKLETHSYGSKVIPSGFFFQPGAEHLSAVMHNPHATLPKFARMGVLAGFGSPEIEMLRIGSQQDHDPDASVPKKFAVEVRSPEYDENWTEGLSVYHNPRALVPLDPNLIPGAAHHFLREDKQIVTYSYDFNPIESLTLIYGPGENPDNPDEAGVTEESSN